MNKYNLSTILFLTVILSFSVTAYTADWKVDFTNVLDTYSDGFTAGAGEPAIDGYDSNDIKQPPTPPSGAYIQMRTLIDSQVLTVDYKEDLIIDTPKTWEITLIAYDPDFVGLDGKNILTWSLDNADNLNLQLIDYGNDINREDSVNTINLKDSSYEFDVTGALGPYRYLDLVVEKTLEPEEIPPEIPPASNNRGGSRGSSRCIPSWRCTDWSECSKDGTQTRTCSDRNDCGRTANKPSEQRTCNYVSLTPFASEVEKINEEIKEEIIEIEEKTVQKTTEIQEVKDEDGLGAITGAAIGETSKPNILIGGLIIFIIVGLGLAVFFLVTKNETFEE